jgi:hypothetical protein
MNHRHQVRELAKPGRDFGQSGADFHSVPFFSLSRFTVPMHLIPRSGGNWFMGRRTKPSINYLRSIRLNASRMFCFLCGSAALREIFRSSSARCTPSDPLFQGERVGGGERGRVKLPALKVRLTRFTVPMRLIPRSGGSWFMGRGTKPSINYLRWIRSHASRISCFLCGSAALREIFRSSSAQCTPSDPLPRGEGEGNAVP